MLNFLKNGPWGNEKRMKHCQHFSKQCKREMKREKMKILHKKIDADMICIISDL